MNQWGKSPLPPIIRTEMPTTTKRRYFRWERRPARMVEYRRNNTQTCTTIAITIGQLDWRWPQWRKTAVKAQLNMFWILLMIIEVKGPRMDSTHSLLLSEFWISSSSSTFRRLPTTLLDTLSSGKRLLLPLKNYAAGPIRPEWNILLYGSLLGHELLWCCHPLGSDIWMKLSV